MPKEIPLFSSDQIFDMTASRGVIDMVDAATKDHIVQYDPSQDIHPNLVSFDKYLAERQIAMRRLILDVPEGKLHVRLQRQYGAVEPRKFGKNNDTFKAPEYAAYRRMDVRYTGSMHVGILGAGREDSYTAYQIHEPDGLMDGLGIITAISMVHRREEVPIDEELEEPVKTAAQRLYEIAANTDDEAEAERFEDTADTATKQETMIVDSHESEGDFRILDARGAHQLMNTISLAIHYGTDQRE